MSLRTDGTEQSLAVAGKSAGRSSAVNGGEFLMLALATCFCNDIYREADRIGVRVDAVELRSGVAVSLVPWTADPGLIFRRRRS